MFPEDAQDAHLIASFLNWSLFTRELLDQRIKAEGFHPSVPSSSRVDICSPFTKVVTPSSNHLTTLWDRAMWILSIDDKIASESVDNLCIAYSLI